MKKIAEIISINGNIAVIKVERSSMCSGCASKTSGNCTCSHGSLLGADKSMTSKAVCNISVSPGDLVEIQTSDSKVLWYATLVFIMPLIVFAACYAVSMHLTVNEGLSFIIGAMGFAITFGIIGLIEHRKKKSTPDIAVVRVISHNDVN